MYQALLGTGISPARPHDMLYDTPVLLGTDIPGSVGRPPHRVIRLAVAIEVSRDRDIIQQPPWFDDRAVGCARNHEPCPIGRPPHGEIRLTIAIEIARHRNIAGKAPWLYDGRTRVTGLGDRRNHTPLPAARPALF